MILFNHQIIFSSLFEYYSCDSSTIILTFTSLAFLPPSSKHNFHFFNETAQFFFAEMFPFCSNEIDQKIINGHVFGSYLHLVS